MNKYNNKRTLKDMQACLDSDDELPTTHAEKAELPAYLDDNRFDEIGDLIEFPWLNTQAIIYPQTQDQENCNSASIETAPETEIHKKEITLSTLSLTTDKGPLPKKSIFEEWNNTISSNQTILQTNKTKTKLSTIPLTTDGHVMIKKESLVEYDNTLGYNTSESKQTAQEIHKREDTPSIFLSTAGGRTLLKKGILKEQDIICMKSFAAQTTDESALLWFINFLQNKDLQSEYKFLKSCLVLSQQINDNCGQMYSQTVSNSSTVKFELVVI